MNRRFLARWRSALLCVSIALLLVTPVAARGPGDPVGPSDATHRVYLPLVLKAGPPPTSFDLIEQALANGTLDDVTALVYKVYATFGDPRLPPAYRGPDSRVPGGTEALLEANMRYDSLPADIQAILLPFLLPAYYVGSWDDQQPAEGPPVAVAPATAVVGAPDAAAGDAVAQATSPLGHPPGKDISGKWSWKGNDRVKIWWRSDRPGDKQTADLVLSAMEDEIWPYLTGLMNRTPLTDEGEQGNGGDKRLDIAITTIKGMGLMLPYPARCTAAPVYLRISRNMSGMDTLGTAAHEFMHALQYTYKAQGACIDNQWLREATATWAEDYVFPKYNTEQPYLPDFMDYPETPLEDTSRLREYADYIFPFYLSHRYTPLLIRQIWEATETQPSGLAAVNSVIPGGFKEVWPEFALYNWNRFPMHDYFLWDQVQAGVQVATTFVSPSLSGDVDEVLATDVKHLAAKYYHFVFPDVTARSIAFFNPFQHIADPAVKVQVLISVDGVWQLPAWDLTAAEGKVFCRDMRAERLDEMLVIITNSNWEDPTHVLKAYHPMSLVATNIGCWRWQGTATGVHVNKRFDTHTTSAEVTFERHRSTQDPAGNMHVETFDSVAGKAVWQVTTSPGANCSYVGGPLTVPLSWDDGTLTLHTIAPGTRGLYIGAGGIDFDSSYDSICEGGTITHPWTNGMWLATDWQTFLYVSEDGLTMKGTAVLQDDSQDYEAYEWHFTALREP